MPLSILTWIELETERVSNYYFQLPFLFGSRSGDTTWETGHHFTLHLSKQKIFELSQSQTLVCTDSHWKTSQILLQRHSSKYKLTVSVIVWKLVLLSHKGDYTCFKDTKIWLLMFPKPNQNSYDNWIILHIHSKLPVDINSSPTLTKITLLYNNATDI